ncbi:MULTISPECIES: DNA gyrase subunit A [unclassified Leptolyngbya]|uniref:DNA gyrase subunit A n=1 Tax=unclassified Leptolyngbya TaxID=2650499 RepID=UPI0016844FA6|nr:MULTISPECIES: DNA gyrase subunit A [unclassified Leptolyngbya]MBD1914039.1 DNA gyrase subunit A [Leptolyngbya sp. FACHB-8]MBD2154006.1 DNA gyrase subunit A [Leptolyngbya sp. FACHB-16]
MAEQLNLPTGNVVSTALHTEVQRSYLEYAMSVIVGRALPDVRDGLKPVHRRILYAMHELGLTPDRPFRKCARVVGDVLGKYHPHGDQAVYDALVRMVQDFSSRYPLLGGHGNFGSVDDDPPAAMRYTETRLSPVSNEAMLTEIGEATVNFIPNFDNSQQEPVVLPAQLPFLVLNGSSGIAVGMATNIPPHNLGEVVDGLIAMIDNPNLSDEALFNFIPGPDFPTGGEIVGTDGVREAYRTGRGSIPVRGVAQFEEIQPGRGRHRRPAIIITELPYQVNKAAWIEKVADLTNQGRLEGIQDIRDESDRDGMRVVIELKREENPQRLLNKLYKMTTLQVNFGAIFLALVDGQPRQMPLKEVLQHFLSFREETLTRQYRHELQKAENQIHVLEGLLRALDNLDAIIDILRNAPDGTTAKTQFQAQFGFSDRQSDAILSMPLRRLTGMERQKLQDDFDQIRTRIQELQRLLTERKELLKALKKELRSLRKQFNDARRTKVLSASERAEEVEGLAGLESEVLEDEVVLEFTQRGYVRRSTPKAFQRQQARLEPPAPKKLVEYDDLATQVEAATTGQQVLVLTRSGKAFAIAVRDIPQTTRQSKGTPLVTLLPQGGSPEEIVAQFVLGDAVDEVELILLTTKGRIKRLPLSEFTNLTARGLTALKLKEDDELQQAILAFPGDNLVLATTGGRLLRFEVNDEQLPIQARSAQGLVALRLGKNESLVGCVALAPEDSFVLVTTQGFGVQRQASSLRLANRGDLGVQGLQFPNKTDTLRSLAPAWSNTSLTVRTEGDRMALIPVDDIPVASRSVAAEALLKLPKGEKIAQVLPDPLPPDEEEGESDLDQQENSEE